MKDIKISWQEQNKSVIMMDLREYLHSSTKLTSNRPQNEPWLAVIKPTTLEQKNYVISLSLDAYHKYTENVIEEFKNECHHLLAMCNSEELEDIRNEEIEKGNKGELYQANEGILRLLIPSRLLDESKKVIEQVFQRTKGSLVKQESSD